MIYWYDGCENVTYMNHRALIAKKITIQNNTQNILTTSISSFSNPPPELSHTRNVQCIYVYGTTWDICTGAVQQLYIEFVHA